jgi:competence ComEA-like helix-hairpin-helix protein
MSSISAQVRTNAWTGIFFILTCALIITFVSILPQEAIVSKTKSHNCVYQVFQNGRSLGAVFIDESSELKTILSELQLHNSIPSHFREKKIPCGRAIHLSESDVMIKQIAGPILITLGARMDINLSEQEDLEAIPGVGNKLAERLIAYREKVGRIQSLDELKNVNGIGAKKLQEISRHVEIGDL